MQLLHIKPVGTFKPFAWGPMDPSLEFTVPAWQTGGAVLHRVSGRHMAPSSAVFCIFSRVQAVERRAAGKGKR